jgi:hypothetical protein
MERPNTVAGLIDKRRELLRLVKDAQEALTTRLADLDHLDATIRLFDPDADLSGLKAKRAASPHPAFKGEMRRHVLGALRGASGPVTSLEIARSFAQGRGLEESAVVAIRKRVGACLWKLRDMGVVTDVPQAGEYKGWRLYALGFLLLGLGAFGLSDALCGNGACS